MKKSNGLFFQLTGVLFFGTLFLLAWIFFKERMLNYDPAFFSFRIIFEKNYDIELSRWGSVVSQVLPLWFLKAGCSLETFLRVYSVSFILIYYLIFLIITLVLKNARAGIMLMLTLCLAFRHAFYYSTAELYQGLAICILIWALIFPEKEYDSILKKNIAWFLSCVLIFVLSYYHQILVFPLLFIFIYYLIAEKKYFDKYLIGSIVFTVFWFFIRIKFLTSTSYEKDKIPELSVFFNQLGNITHFESYDYFKHFARHFLLPLVILNLICVGTFLFKRKWLLASFYILFNTGFIYLDLLTYRMGESPLMYENYLTILGLFCSVPLSGLLMSIKTEKLFLPVTFVILMINVQGVYSSSYPFTLKENYLKRITEYGRKMPNKKYLIDSRNLPWQYDWVSWALPFETLLYSSLESPDSAVSICASTPVSQYDSISNWKNIFLGPPWAITWFWTSDVDKKYYLLPSGEYKKLTTYQSDSSFQESVFNNQNISIEPLENFIEIDKEKYAVLPLRIKNNSGESIKSIPDCPQNIKLSYHILNEKGEQVIWDGSRTSLETDIDKETTQGLMISSVLPQGKYILEIDFVTEGKRWWNINTRVKLSVN